MAAPQYTLSTGWDDINFPVQLVPFQELMPAYESLARDRQTFIVGRQPGAKKEQIFGLQGPTYSLIPNSLIETVARRVLGDHTVQVLHNGRGEFSINIALPQQEFNVVNARRAGHQLAGRPDTLQKSLILTNSYTGKSHFTIQGQTIGNYFSKTVETVKARMKISFNRLICVNGLMGWVDEFMDLDQYADWLAAGQPTKYTNVVDTKTEFIPQRDFMTIHQDVEKEETLSLRRIAHKGVNLKLFENELENLMKQFLAAQDSLTLQLYERMANRRIQLKKADSFLKKVALPKSLVKSAIEQMEIECGQLRVQPNMWLLYNGVNHALLQGANSLSMADRYGKDQQAFHHLAKHVI